MVHGYEYSSHFPSFPPSLLIILSRRKQTGSPGMPTELSEPVIRAVPSLEVGVSDQAAETSKRGQRSVGSIKGIFLPRATQEDDREGGGPAESGGWLTRG